MDRRPVDPNPAATVMVLRPSRPGFEVLMVRRRRRGFFGGLVVFPGGGVDATDRSDQATAVVRSDSFDRSHRAAVLRELAEETGILLGSNDAHGAPEERGPAFYSALLAHRVELDGDRLVLVSRWITPEMAPRRYDTRFYLTAADDVPEVRIDESELVAHDWVTPTEALRRHREQDWPMILPTLAHLRWLERRVSIADALETAGGADGRTPVEPRRMEDGSMVPLLLPAEPA